MTGCEDVPEVQRPRLPVIDQEDEWCGWKGVAMTVKVSADGPTTRIAITVPKSVNAALKLTSIKQRRTQGDIVTEALLKFFTAPVGSYPPKVKEGGE